MSIFASFEKLSFWFSLPKLRPPDTLLTVSLGLSLSPPGWQEVSSTDSPMHWQSLSGTVYKLCHTEKAVALRWWRNIILVNYPNGAETSASSASIGSNQLPSTLKIFDESRKDWQKISASENIQTLAFLQNSNTKNLSLNKVL